VIETYHVVIFRLHPPHTIQNSLQTLGVLSHSRIVHLYQLNQALAKYHRTPKLCTHCAVLCYTVLCNHVLHLEKVHKGLRKQ